MRGVGEGKKSFHIGGPRQSFAMASVRGLFVISTGWEIVLRAAQLSTNKVWASFREKLTSYWRASAIIAYASVKGLLVAEEAVRFAYEY